MALTDPPSELEMVFQNPDPITVRMARDMLSDAGIEVFVFDDETSRMLGSTVAIEPRLMAHANRAAEARELLRELGFE